MKKNMMLLLGLIAIILSLFLCYIKYSEYVAKTQGKTILVNIVEVQDCETYSKKYLVGFAYLGKVHYISTGKTDCREYASKKTMEVIYYDKTNKFISVHANPLREILLASLIGIVGIALTIKGLAMSKKT